MITGRQRAFLVLTGCLLLLLGPELMTALHPPPDVLPVDQVRAVALSLLVFAIPWMLAHNARQALLLSTPLAAVSFVVLSYSVAFGELPTWTAAYAILSSNRREAATFMTYFALNILGAWAGLLLYVTLCWRLPRDWLTTSSRQRTTMLMSCAALLAVDHALDVATFDNILLSAPAMANAYPLSVARMVTEALEHADNERLRSLWQNYRFPNVSGPAPQDAPLVVVIVGESARYDHWGINGYGRPTSPRLAGYGADTLYNFSDLTAAANQTALAVPLALSGIRPQAYEDTFTHRSVVSLFNQAGFTTAWLGNEDASLRMAREAQTRYFAVERRTDEQEVNKEPLDQGPFDDDILPRLDKELARGMPRQAIFLHTMGSHGDYRFRYRASETVFGDPKRPLGLSVYYAKLISEQDRLRVIDYYDNSIVATDRFIDEVTKRAFATHRKALVVYFSDHGENLWDDDRRLSWHGSHLPSRWEVHVPLFVLASPEYRRAFPAQVAAMRRHEHLAIAQQNMFFALADLAGIHFRGEHPELAFSNPRYVAPKQRYVYSSDGKVREVNECK